VSVTVRLNRMQCRQMTCPLREFPVSLMRVNIWQSVVQEIPNSHPGRTICRRIGDFAATARGQATQRSHKPTLQPVVSSQDATAITIITENQRWLHVHQSATFPSPLGRPHYRRRSPRRLDGWVGGRERQSGKRWRCWGLLGFYRGGCQSVRWDPAFVRCESHQAG
jgi:hypothetical protein